MKSKISISKFSLNIIIAFALLSTIISFEYLPIWENNQKKIVLSEDLKNAEIIDYTINNYTKTNNILYSISQDDNYYFHINGKNYIHYYKDFKYFTSPLIENNKEYYFCTSLNHIIKITSNGAVEEIPNPKCLDDVTVSELKCFYLPNEKVIVVVFMNTNFVNYYKLENNGWLKNEENCEPFTESNIMEANAYNVENKSQFYFFLLFKVDSNYKLFGYISYYEYNFESHFKVEFNGNIYSKKLISFGIWNSNPIGYVFTYEPKLLNKYNFFYIKLVENKCMVNNGSDYLTMFKEAEIYDAFFIENSPFLVYIIKKREKDSTSNFYLGAVDIESFVILYNIKINNEKKVFFDNGYLYQDKGFLNIFENGKQIQICPFYYDSDDLCKLNLNNNQYFYIDKSYGLNINIMKDFCPYGNLLNKYCIEECPNGLGMKDGKCILCPTEYSPYLKYGSKQCEGWIDPYSPFPQNGNIYYDCNLKYFENNCYSYCSEIYGINKDNSNECDTCESKSQIFNNDICIDSCVSDKGIGKVNMELNGINYTFCKNCSEIGEFYYNNTCYDKCPFSSQLYDEKKNCYFCYEINPKKPFNLNGTCVSGCEKGYQKIEKGEEIYCRYCKEENLYFAHNEKCEPSCEEHSLYYPENNICYFCNETEKNLYYQNNSCVSKCDKGYEAIKKEGDLYCNYCHNKSQYYYNEKCEEKCPEGYAWNVTDNICVNCFEELGKFLKDHSCVASCGTYRLINNTCQQCPQDNFFFEYQCVEKCPENTVLFDKTYCKICNGKIENKLCVDECSKGYVVNKTKIGGTNIEVDKCVTCEELNNNSWYNGNECVENCPKTKYHAKDNICHLCFCGFSTYKCDEESDKCICNNTKVQGEIFGNNCEFFSKTKRDAKILSILPIGSVISSKKSYFTFNLTNYINENYKYSIRWSLSIDSNEITDLQNFATGVNEKIFIINSDVLQPGEISNELELEVNITDENNKNENVLKDKISIYIQYINQKREIMLDSSDGINKVMNNTFLLDVSNLAGIDDYKFYYRFLIKDEHNEIIPIKQREELDSLVNKQSKKLSFMLPIFKNFFFELSNNREEKYLATDINKINENINIKYSLNDIFNDSISEYFDEIEKIFLIMKYLDINKNNNLNISKNDYDNLFNFIRNKTKVIAIYNGTYESPRSNKALNLNENTIRYYINYYEPKTIFSLMNKLFLNQKTKIPEKYFNETINIFIEFFDILIKINHTEKLDNSNILSFFRTFDHFLSIYINKEKEENKDIINKTAVFEILNKLSEYLINEIYPGETIRLVGKKISFFLSRFGEYQNIISFSQINDISQKIKYDNYSTFSFYDYNINQEKCDDEGNTLLCVKNENYKKFKEKILNIQDYAISLLSININKDELFQDKSEGNTFKLNLMSPIKKQIPNNISFFYDIEFPFYYIPSSSSKSNKKIIFLESQNNEEKNYENIVCVPKNHLYSEEHYCLTYFNYETNIIKCSCNIIDEITFVSDNKIASFYKKLQTKDKFKAYGKFNKISLYGIFGLLAFILLPNIIYLIYEIKNDIKKAKYKLLSYSEKIKDNYLQVKALNNTSICSFSILAFIYRFPYLSPLRNSNLQTPKYIKHFIVTLALAYGISITLLLFLFFTPFSEKNDIIDKRDIKNTDFKVIDQQIIFRYLNRSIVFSFFSLIISCLFIYVMGIILSFNNEENKYWKHMKTFFSNYVTNKIKREVLLGSTWNKIKLRMIAYYNICGNYILSKKLKKNRKDNKIFEEYLNKSQIKRGENENLLLPPDDNEEMTELTDKKNKGRKYQPPSINKNKENIKNENFSVGAINDSRECSINVNPNIKIEHMDSFQLYSRKMKVDKSIDKKNKFERIKNKYICKKPARDSYEDEIDIGSRSCSFENNNCYKELEIQYENNISFLFIEEFIINESIIKKQTKACKSSTVSISTTQNPEGYWKIIITSFILVILLLILVIIMFQNIKKLLNEFGFFIINIWIGTSIFMYLIVYPLFYYIKIFIGSFLLFKCYQLKYRSIGKFFFWLFVDKTMIYIFKVRNYITKYKKELNY